MGSLKVIEMNGQKTIDSRLVAEALEVRHTDLLRKISGYEEILLNAKLRSVEFFIPSEYKDSTGRILKCYMLTKKGCEMVANKTTGEKGVIFTAMYVEAFNEMEQQQSKLPTDPMSILRLTYEALGQTSDRVDKIETDVKAIKENQSITPGEYNYLNKRVRSRIKEIKQVRDLTLTAKQNSHLFHAIGRDLTAFTNVHTRSQIRSKDFEKALQFINNWEPSYTDLQIINQLSLDI